MRGKVLYNLPQANKVAIEERAITLARYIIDSKDTVRGAAKKFCISKSTVHKDVTERLLKINPILAKEVREILDENKAERHIRGGMATKLKYMKKEFSEVSCFSILFGKAAHGSVQRFPVTGSHLFPALCGA